MKCTVTAHLVSILDNPEKGHLSVTTTCNLFNDNLWNDILSKAEIYFEIFTFWYYIKKKSLDTDLAIII